jgi:hypothetical protein
MDVVVAAGDFASVHRGLEELIAVLVVIETRPSSFLATLRPTRPCVPPAPARHGSGDPLLR